MRPRLWPSVLGDLQAHPGSAAMDVALRLDLHRWQVSMCLQFLRRSGLVRPSGLGPATRWSATSHSEICR